MTHVVVQSRSIATLAGSLACALLLAAAGCGHDEKLGAAGPGSAASPGGEGGRPYAPAGGPAGGGEVTAGGEDAGAAGRTTASPGGEATAPGGTSGQTSGGAPTGAQAGVATGGAVNGGGAGVGAAAGTTASGGSSVGTGGTAGDGSGGTPNGAAGAAVGGTPTGGATLAGVGGDGGAPAAQPQCGNSILEGGEACEPALLPADVPCSELDPRYVSGSLSCSDTCEVVSDACVLSGPCGDSILDQGEDCDDGNTEDGDGCSANCFYEDGTLSPFTCGLSWPWWPFKQEIPPPDAADLCDDPDVRDLHAEAGPVGLRIKVHVVESSRTGDPAATEEEVAAMIATTHRMFEQVRIGLTWDGLTSIDYIDGGQKDQFFNLSTESFWALTVINDDPNAIDVYLVNSFTGFKGLSRSIGQDRRIAGNEAVALPAANWAGTLAHELGHVFGLFHTHHVGGRQACLGITRPDCCALPDFDEPVDCDRADDRCCDTPYDPGPKGTEREGCGRCEARLHYECSGLCDGRYTPDYRNVMSYYECALRYSALARLSPEQIARAHCFIDRHYAYARLACTPDCTFRCGGMSDGCGGVCEQACPAAPDLDETLDRLRACSTSFPQATHVFAVRSVTPGPFDMQEFAHRGCFIADNAVDGIAPTTEPEKTAFRLEFEASNPGAVLARSSPFINVSIEQVESLGIPDAALVRVQCGEGALWEPVRTWFDTSYALSPVSPEGELAILQITGDEAAKAVHPVLYVDSLIDSLWYHVPDDVCGDGVDPADVRVDIDGDGVPDDRQDPRWVAAQQALLDRVRSEYGVGIVGHVTDAGAACKFAPHLNGADTELGGYTADPLGSRPDTDRAPVSHLRAWHTGTARCAGGAPCYRGVFTTASPELDALLHGRPLPWERDDVLLPGGPVSQMRADEPRIAAAHVLAALTESAALPGTTYWWSVAPFPSPWLDVEQGRGPGWLGVPTGDFSRVRSLDRDPIDLREFEQGVVLWNDLESTEVVDMSGWLGSPANLASTGASESRVVDTVTLEPRTGAVLLRPSGLPAALPAAWTDDRIEQIPIPPGEQDQPLRVTVYYELDASVTAVNGMEGWTTGFAWGPWDTNCVLSGSPPYSCDVPVECVTTDLAVFIRVAPFAPGSEQEGACYSDGYGHYTARGTAWIETNHGQRIYLSCVPGGEDPAWSTNFGLPPGVVLY